jgi:nucleoside-diphosphate-sugar epimerase
VKRVLVIGSTSVAGLAVAGALRPETEVTMAGRRNADILLDIAGDVELPEMDTNYDVVINFAAHFDVQSPRDMLEAARVNALGALNACILAKTAGAGHMVQVSSISAGHTSESSFFNAYALTKRHGEELSELFCSTHSLPLTILRPSQLYDATGAARPHQRMLYHILDQAAAGRDITIFGQRDPRRNYLFVQDFAEVCRRVVAQGTTGTFTVAHQQAHRLSDIANLAYQGFGTEGTISFDRDKPDLEDIEAQMDGALVSAIDYTPATSLAKGIELFRQHQESGR